MIRHGRCLTTLARVFDEPFVLIRDFFDWDDAYTTFLRKKCSAGNRVSIFNAGEGGRHQYRLGLMNFKLCPQIAQLIATTETFCKLAFPEHHPRDWVVLESKKNCCEQDRHTDYSRKDVEASISQYGMQCCPFSVLLCFTDGMVLPIWRSTTAQREIQHLNRGDMMIFKGTTIHAGGEYPVGHFGRFHFYLDHPLVAREFDSTDKVDELDEANDSDSKAL